MAPVTRALLACGCAALLAPATALAAPKVSIFYYPWWGTPAHDGQYQHWQQFGRTPPNDIGSNYYPARGVYSSSDPAVVRSQMDEIEAAGIGEVVVSWWGRGTPEDKRLGVVIAAAKRDGLAVAAHIEPYTRRTPTGVADDIRYLRTLGIGTFYIFQPSDWSTAEWAAMNDAVLATVYAQTNLVGFAAAGHFDGVYTYDTLTYTGDKLARLCNQAHADHLLCLPSVGPGYDARRATTDVRVKPRRNGATYDSMWHAAIAAHPDAVTITSFNEWHEGTQIEPAASRTGYLSYDRAWGKHGAAAETAYLTRTRYWVSRLK